MYSYTFALVAAGSGFKMVCKHEFNYVGDQKGRTASNRYFKCTLCGCVKVKADDGTEYLIPRPKDDKQE